MRFTSKQWNPDSFEVSESFAINLAKISSYFHETDMSAVFIQILWSSAGLGHSYGVSKGAYYILYW